MTIGSGIAVSGWFLTNRPRTSVTRARNGAFSGNDASTTRSGRIVTKSGCSTLRHTTPVSTFSNTYFGNSILASPLESVTTGGFVTPLISGAQLYQPELYEPGFVRTPSRLRVAPGIGNPAASTTRSSATGLCGLANDRQITIPITTIATPAIALRRNLATFAL